MRLSQSKRGDNKASRSSAVLDLAPDGHRGLIQPKKVPNPIRESQSHWDLHRELLFSHSRGILPRHRTKLPWVLESRRLRQLWEELQGPPSDLEQQLRKCHQRLEEHKREVAGPEPDPHPKFLLVRDSLQKMKLVKPVPGRREPKPAQQSSLSPPAHTGLPLSPAHLSTENGTRRCHSG